VLSERLSPGQVDCALQDTDLRSRLRLGRVTAVARDHSEGGRSGRDCLRFHGQRESEMVDRLTVVIKKLEDTRA